MPTPRALLQQPIKMRIKATFTVNGQPVTEQWQVENFPAGL